MQGEFSQTVVLASIAGSGPYEEVRDLLKAGAHPDARDARGNSALSNASRAGRADVVSLLLENGAEVNIRGIQGDTALIGAASRGHMMAATVLHTDLA